MRRVAAVILAAGGSTRMGSPKQLLIYQGKSLLRRAIDAVAGAGCDPAVVVLGGAMESTLKELAGTSARAAVNEQWERGIGTSIRRGFQELQQPDIEAAVILLCDQPLVDASAIRRLIEASKVCEKPVCASSYADTIGPPVLVSRLLFPQLLVLPDASGAKALWAGNTQIVCEVPCPLAAIDIDSPEDYQHLCGDGESER